MLGIFEIRMLKNTKEFRPELQPESFTKGGGIKPGALN